MEAYFDFIQVDMYYFFTVSTNFRDLPIKIDWVPTAGATCNDQSNYLCFLLHSNIPFKITKI
jgi:hypothetical protein